MDTEEADGFIVYAHGFNGDYTFTEPWEFSGTLDAARRSALAAMEVERFRNVLADGTPTIRWMEIFGPGIEESLGLEERDGELVWTP